MQANMKIFENTRVSSREINNKFKNERYVLISKKSIYLNNLLLIQYRFSDIVDYH